MARQKIAKLAVSEAKALRSGPAAVLKRLEKYDGPKLTVVVDGKRITLVTRSPAEESHDMRLEDARSCYFVYLYYPSFWISCSCVFVRSY